MVRHQSLWNFIYDTKNCMDVDESENDFEENLEVNKENAAPVL